MSKYYKVIKENFLWDVDGILEKNENLGRNGGYRAINDLFKKHEGDEYITAEIIENSPEYFQQVYKVDLVTQVVYETKDVAKKLLTQVFKTT